MIDIVVELGHSETACGIFVVWLPVTFFVWRLRTNGKVRVVCFNAVVIRTIYNEYGSQTRKMRYGVAIVYNPPTVSNQPIVLKSVVIISNARHSECVQNYVFPRNDVMISNICAGKRGNRSSQRVAADPQFVACVL